MLTKKKETSPDVSLNKIVKSCIADGNFPDAHKTIADAMARFPHDAIPHNLMGILLEHENDHDLAMRHFRAALALDPNFRPPLFNMDKYGSFGENRFCEDAYENSDCLNAFDHAVQHKIEWGRIGFGCTIKN